MATYRNTFRNMTEGGQQLSVSDEIVASQETRNVEVSRKLFSLQSTVFYHFYPIKLKWGQVFNKYPFPVHWYHNTNHWKHKTDRSLIFRAYYLVLNS